ncbi:hypothetical protein PIB30_001970 [Stylosanthes scabra]|uniref:Uncharacterized protein n=1 Tax=Stylosanthes scabra TaxID=79078 RepID=A0ABU6Z0S9_9FABA|nr:hypothetical protein [Stylosanthes scabra]
MVDKKKQDSGTKYGEEDRKGNDNAPSWCLMQVEWETGSYYASSSGMVSSKGRQLAFLFSNDLQRKPLHTELLDPGPSLHGPGPLSPMLPTPNVAALALGRSASSLGGEDTNRSLSECLRIITSFLCFSNATCSCRSGAS